MTRHDELDTAPLFERVAPPVDPSRGAAVVDRSMRVAARRRRTRAAAVAVPVLAALLVLPLAATRGDRDQQRIRAGEGPTREVPASDAAVLVAVEAADGERRTAGIVVGPELVAVPLESVSGARRITVRNGVSPDREATLTTTMRSYHVAALHVPGLPSAVASLTPPELEPGEDAALLTLDPDDLATSHVPVSLTRSTRATDGLMAGLLGIGAEVGRDLPVALVDGEGRVAALPVATVEDQLAAIRSRQLWALVSSAAGEGHPGIRVGRRHPYSFSLHCGLVPLRFGGRWWKVVAPPPETLRVRQPEPSGVAVSFVEEVVGEAWLSEDDVLMFRADNTVEPVELRYEPGKAPAYGCA